MKYKVVIIGELKEKTVSSNTLECITVAREISPLAEIIVLLFGDKEIEKKAEELLLYNIDKIVIATHSRLSRYSVECYAEALLDVMAKEAPNILIASHTPIAQSLFPVISERLQIPLLSNIVQLEKKETFYNFSRPAISGKFYEQVTSSSMESFMVTICAKQWTVAEKQPCKTGEIELFPVEIKETRFSLVKLEKKAMNVGDLSEAKIIVAGGRGLKNEDGFALISQLAEKLGGTVGVSRGAVELGVCDSSLQIGQTGSIVAPDIYIACGISGAIQHIVGITSAKTIIAINQDPDAPIFNVADYGIVGDLFQVIPQILEALDTI